MLAGRDALAGGDRGGRESSSARTTSSSAASASARAWVVRRCSSRIAPTVLDNSSLSSCVTSSHTRAACTGVGFTATREPTRASTLHCGGSLSDVLMEIDTGCPLRERFPRASVAGVRVAPASCGGAADSAGGTTDPSSVSWTTSGGSADVWGARPWPGGGVGCRPIGPDGCGTRGALWVGAGGGPNAAGALDARDCRATGRQRWNVAIGWLGSDPRG